MHLLRSLRLSVVPVVAGIAVAAACSDSTSPADPLVASLEAMGPADTLGLTDTVRVSVIARDAAGAAMTGLVIAFRSLHPLVARVDDSGLVTGIAAGNASIVATVDGRAEVADTVLVRVRSVPRTLVIAGLADTLPAAYEPAWNGTVRDTALATVRDGRGSVLSVPVRWSSSDTTVATVTAAGVVTLREPGVAWIRADAGRTAVDSQFVRGTALRVNGPAYDGFDVAQWGTPRLGELSCGRSTAGEAWCASVTELAQPVPGGRRFSALALGRLSACGLVAADSTLACWGQNGSAQLGLGTTTPASAATPVVAAEGRRFRAVDIGPTNTVCALGAADSLVYCWGNNGVGATGEPPFGIDSSVGPVAGLPKATAVAVGMWHACAIVVDASVWCWGDGGSFARLSGPPTQRYRAPMRLAPAAGYEMIVATDFGACMLDGAGVVRCLMRANGDEGTLLRTLPGLTMARIAGGRGGDACGISTSGALYCWNPYSADDAVTTLMARPWFRGRTVRDVSVSTYTLCATTDDFSVYCW